MLLPAAVLLAVAGSPAWGEEGRAPGGFILAAGVLALLAAVPALAFSPFGPPPAAPPPPPAAPPAAPPPPGAAINDDIGAAARARARAEAQNVLFSIILPLCVAHMARQQG